MSDLSVRPDDAELRIVRTAHSDRNFEVPCSLIPVLGMNGIFPHCSWDLPYRLPGLIEKMHLVIPGYLVLVEIMLPNTNLRSVERKLEPPENILEFSL